MTDRVDRIVEQLQKKWPYIDIDRNAPEYVEDWRELVEDVLTIAKATRSPRRVEQMTQGPGELR